MKNLALALVLTASSSAFAGTAAPAAFACPSEKSFLKTFDKLLNGAQAIDASSAVEAAQKDAYFKVFATGIPNDDAIVNHFKLSGQAYDLVATKDDFVWNDPNYMDAYAVVFAAGSDVPVAKIQTDTDRHDYRCELIAAAPANDDGAQPTAGAGRKPAQGDDASNLPDVKKIVLPAAEFDTITIDSPQDVPVEINGVRYPHFYVISANVAEAIDADGNLTLVYRGE